MRRAIWANVATVALLGFMATASRSAVYVPMPELTGPFVCNETVKYATVNFGHPILAADSLKVHWTGTIAPGQALYDGRVVPWDGCLFLEVLDSGAWAHAGICWPRGGQFDYSSPFVHHDFLFLADGQVSLRATFDCNIPPVDVSFELLLPPTCTLNSAELTAYEVVPTAETSWGAIKSLYR